MFDELNRLADEPFSPHWVCYHALKPLIWLHVASDALTGLAYVAISLTLAYLVYRVRNLPFHWMFLAFGVFIISCGLTHFMSVLVVWDPRYWLEGFVKAVTAVASVGTALCLPPLVPRAVALFRAAELSEVRRRRLEEANVELEKLVQQVRQLDELKTQFFANVSHELRTPLTLILGPAEKLLGDAGLAPEQRADLETLARNARTLLKQVNDLLDVAKIDAKGMGVRYAAADLAGLVRLTADHFSSLAEARGIEFRVEAPERLPAEVDAEKVQRVLLNLLSNAFRFVPDGGRVRLALRAEGGRAVVAVADSGPGVPPDQREAVFERFRQADAGGRRPGGTGLGLAIARDFVELHGGTITAGDAPEGGALFTVVLPLAAPAGTPVKGEPPGPPDGDAVKHALAELRVPAAPKPAGGRGEGLVLVVEDSADMRAFVAATLAGEFRIATARDGDEGLAKALELRPDLVLSDVMMPGGGGDELLLRVRGRRELDGVPVVLLTARADAELRLRLLREGAADYLVKPFAAEELRARVTNLVGMKRARDVLRQDTEDRQTGLEFLAREVTLRKREAEAARDMAQAARDQAEHATRVKGHFLRMVSHELRTPLTALVLNLGILRRDPAAPLTPPQDELAGKIGLSVQRLRNLIESIIQYADLQSAGRPGKVEPLDAAALAAEVTEEARPPAERKGLALRLSAPAGLAPLCSDRRLLRLVLANLLDNAVKFTERGSVEVALAPRVDGLALTVRDTGPGIPDAKRATIFEPFEHLEPVQRKHTPGVGLGLTVVRELVLSLGGTIAVESCVGEGSAFTVVLPSLDEALPPGGAA